MYYTIRFSFVTADAAEIQTSWWLTDRSGDDLVVQKL